MTFTAHARRAIRDAVEHVGQSVRVSLCGADSFDVCAIYWRRSSEVFSADAGMLVESSTHWVQFAASDLTGHRMPRAGDEMVIDGRVFTIADAPRADAYSIRARLHVVNADGDEFCEPGFGAY
ncbi:MAG: head-tail joining protein [Fluviibacter sp.]